MSHPPATVDIRPSEAYREVTGSLVYRLSELMFGSLLAAYSLGFVGAIAAHGTQLSAHGRLGSVLLALQYFCISAAFAYLTTSFYLTYHVGILTMPQLRFDRLGRDFTIAISQAFFFGLSMLWPASFPVSLSFNFLLSGMRKNEEYKNLAERLFEQHSGVKPGADFEAFQIFRDELATLLRGKRLLSAWGPIGRDIRKYGWLAFIVGVIVGGLCLALEYEIPWLQKFLLSVPQGLEGKWVQQQFLISGELLVATFIIILYGSRVLKRRASFIGFPVKNPGSRSEQPETKDTDSNVQSNSQTDKHPLMDREFDDLQVKLNDLCKRLFPQS
jgi:hypothetical protein